MDVAIKSVMSAALLMLACALPCTGALAQESVFLAPRDQSPPAAPRSVSAPAAQAQSAGVGIAPSPVMPDDVSGNRQGFDPAPYVLTDSGRSVVLGRYSTSSADPPSDLIEPVNAVASLTFPRQTVRSIREAIDYALLRSGYRFDDGAVDDAGRRFLELPLPESQRQIGPYPLSTILSVLMGSAWQPAVDLAGRVVSIRATAQTSTPCAVTGRCLVRVTWMAQGAASIAGAAPVKPVSSGLQTNPAPVNRIYPNPKAGETP